MKNLIISPIILITAFVGNILTHNNSRDTKIYVQGADGNYTLTISFEYFNGFCAPLSLEVCAYEQINYASTLPQTLSPDQVYELSDPDFGPKRLQPMLDPFNQPVKGVFYPEF